MTLTEGQGHSLYIEIGKYPFNNFWQYLIPKEDVEYIEQDFLWWK